MNIKDFKHIYFIGIGGIGMSALARYFKILGKNVAGYDKSVTILSKELENQGINVNYEDSLATIEEKYLNVNDTLVVITPAIPREHLQMNYFKNNNFKIKKRAEVLGMITQDTFCFAVAGTHGKTTTSAILAHILYQSGVDVTSFLGGILENYNSNLVGNGKTVSVVEADEFDRSFLHLHPDMACITSIDADHLDIYGDKNTIEQTFLEFSKKIENTNNLFTPLGVPFQATKIGIEEQAAIIAKNIFIENGNYIFDIQYHEEFISKVKFGLPGRHNLSNALIAFAMAKNYGLENNQIKSALESFKGIKRRFSYIIKNDQLVFIDDYAHHPTEINAVYQAITELYYDKKIVAVFQPHLFSRTRDFADDFAKSLSQFDNLLLMEIYPARELPIEGITSTWLLQKISSKNKKLVSKSTLINEIKNQNPEVLVTIGAGDIGEMILEIKENFK
ncbi:MAG: UDP-N-acetylmuramate--L-alanine ligase [Flavobacterium sp.]